MSNQRRKNLTNWKIYHCRPDTFDIESSRDSFIKEGWASLDEQKIAKLRELSLGFLDRLTPHSQNIAKKLLADLPVLLNAGGRHSDIKKLVFCHHDIRQSIWLGIPNTTLS